MGFVKSFRLADIRGFSQDISKTNGILWLITTLFFISAGILYHFNFSFWWMVSSGAILISQYLIFITWSLARYGSVLNAVILLGIVIGIGTWYFKKKFELEVLTELKQTNIHVPKLLTEADIVSLPDPVKNYLRYSGAVNKPGVNNFSAEFKGQIRKNEQSEWMPFSSVQYNFIENPTRLFFMNATMAKLPVAGFHHYKSGHAYMDIRLLSLMKVQYQAGNEMGIAETVTFFNDMCVLAPATLIDKRITWLEAERDRVKAIFTNNLISISAWLYFNDSGQLINFVSDDRYASGEDQTMTRLQWSTPLKNYKEINGVKLASYADAIYHYPEHQLIYGNFRLTRLQYNCDESDPLMK